MQPLLDTSEPGVVSKCSLDMGVPRADARDAPGIFRKGWVRGLFRTATVSIWHGSTMRPAARGQRGVLYISERGALDPYVTSKPVVHSHHTRHERPRHSPAPPPARRHPPPPRREAPPPPGVPLAPRLRSRGARAFGLRVCVLQVVPPLAHPGAVLDAVVVF